MKTNMVRKNLLPEFLSKKNITVETTFTISGLAFIYQSLSKTDNSGIDISIHSSNTFLDKDGEEFDCFDVWYAMPNGEMTEAEELGSKFISCEIDESGALVVTNQVGHVTSEYDIDSGEYEQKWHSEETLSFVFTPEEIDIGLNLVFCYRLQALGEAEELEVYRSFEGMKKGLLSDLDIALNQEQLNNYESIDCVMDLDIFFSTEVHLSKEHGVYLSLWESEIKD